jgi:hypothetical protein
LGVWEEELLDLDAAFGEELLGVAAELGLALLDELVQLGGELKPLLWAEGIALEEGGDLLVNGWWWHESPL